MKPTPLVLDYIDRCLTYDSETGIVSNKGKPIGSSRKNRNDPTSYLVVSLRLDSTYQGCSLSYTTYAHILAWYLSSGEWPTVYVDHIDGNGTNNRLANLRPATYKQNVGNRHKMRRKVSSRYKGVCKVKNRWRAYIYHDYKMINLGYHSTQVEAARAYNTKAKEIWGEYAKLNQIDWQ